MVARMLVPAVTGRALGFRDKHTWVQIGPIPVAVSVVFAKAQWMGTRPMRLHVDGRMMGLCLIGGGLLGNEADMDSAETRAQRASRDG
jgi:hypothetical protein